MKVKRKKKKQFYQEKLYPLFLGQEIVRLQDQVAELNHSLNTLGVLSRKAFRWMGTSDTTMETLYKETKKELAS